MLTIAVSKGRIYEEALPLLAEAGITPVDDPKTSRKLILSTTRDDVQLVIIRATDVPTFVEYGAADLGIAGKDVLLEHGAEALYEPLDLKIACCRLMTATHLNAPEPKGRIRVATKYVKTARKYFANNLKK
jgi:ATP phosphoribosyltransferase